MNQYIKNKSDIMSEMMVWAFFVIGIYMFYLGYKSTQADQPITILIMATVAGIIAISPVIKRFCALISFLQKEIWWERLFLPKKQYMPPDWTPPRKKTIPRFTTIRYHNEDGEEKEISLPEPEISAWK